MSARTGFGDEIWRLAQAGDAEALRRAADLLLSEQLDVEYDGHRARAFALVVEGKTADAAEELDRGWTEEWPFPAAFAADRARIYYLAGDEREALKALLVGARGAEQLDPGVREVAIACVRGRRSLWLRATRVVLAGGRPVQRLAAATAVLAALFTLRPRSF